MSLSLALAALLAACGSDGTSPEPQDPSIVGTVTPAGGTLQTTDGKASLTFPPGAVSSGVEITVEPVDNPAADPNLAAGTAYEFGPDGTQFAEPVDLTLQFDLSNVPGSRDARAARISKLVGGVWTPVPGTPTVNVSTGKVTNQISSFSSYSVTVDPCWPAILPAFGPNASRSLSNGWDDRDCLFVPTGADPAQGKHQDIYQLQLLQPGALRVQLSSPGVEVIAGITDVPSGAGTGTALIFDREPGEVDFNALLPAGTYRLWLGRDDGVAQGSYASTLSVVSTDNAAGCGGVGLVPPFSGAQKLEDGVDCKVKIQFPAPGSEGALGKEVLEEYYVFKGFAGVTYTFAVAKTGGDAAFAPYPTIFLGGGQVVQPQDPSSPTNSVSFTAQTTRYYLLGVSGGLGEGWQYQQGSYTLTASAS